MPIMRGAALGGKSIRCEMEIVGSRVSSQEMSKAKSESSFLSLRTEGGDLITLGATWTIVRTEVPQYAIAGSQSHRHGRTATPIHHCQPVPFSAGCHLTTGHLDQDQCCSVYHIFVHLRNSFPVWLDTRVLSTSHFENLRPLRWHKPKSSMDHNEAAVLHRVASL